MFRDLSVDEQKLLATACQPFMIPSPRGGEPGWPVWDFVARTFSSESQSNLVPEDILAGLPVGVAPDGGEPYRLFWVRDGIRAGQPKDDSIFGLTVAGMHAVRSLVPRLGELADSLAAYIGALAAAELQLSPSPNEVAKWDAPLQDITVGTYLQGRPYPVTLKASVAAEVVRREYAPINVQITSEAVTCQVRGRSLRAFLGVNTAEQYLARAWHYQLPAQEPVLASPMTLIQTIDYFGYVLEASALWRSSGGGSVVRVRSLKSAASLSQSASTVEEFDNRISSLCTIIDHFALPDVPPEILKKRFSGQQGSLNSLTYFLERMVVDEPYSSSVKEALGKLRDVRHLRTAAQHDSERPRRQAAEARSRFGLAPIAVDWAGDWDAIRAHLANAFTSIIEAVQASDDHL
ncbi:hypothetical protein D4765_18240 [Subtercola vilae]|uniref:Uncharacterized protein n=1 Tax=Subtercola vilae TaxID=2056433 RepID=A0A4T2BIC7_9MICO|nr:hypothetical protein D4765_18240 [Subtercola vilae]